MGKSNIEWCTDVWNVSVGCSRVSTGCERCFAERFASRGLTPAHKGLTVTSQKGPRWTGEVRLFPERLDQPLRWRKPRRIFVDSMSDLFHEKVPDDFILEVFTVMAVARQHEFQILTKRPARMRSLLSSWSCEDIYLYWHSHSEESPAAEAWPLPNVWLGTSVENQETADERIPHLLATPAAVRFLSLEPLLKEIMLIGGAWGYPEAWTVESGMIDWVIVGGESGPGARPCEVEWIRSIVEQCKAAGVPVFVKQLGANYVDALNGIGGFQTRPPADMGITIRNLKSRKGADMAEWPEDLRVRELPT